MHQTQRFLYILFAGLFFVFFPSFENAVKISQDTVITIPPGITWVDADLVYEGNGSHDNFVLRGSGPASRMAFRNNAHLYLINIERWMIENIQFIKVSGSTPIDHMIIISNSSWGWFHNNLIEGFGLASGVAIIGNSSGNWFDGNKILGVNGLSVATRGIGIKFDMNGSLDNRLTNTITHPFQQGALGDSMVAVIGQTAGFYIENLDSNPCFGCWTLDIEGANNAEGVHRESYIMNIGSAILPGNRGVVRIVKAENVTLDHLVVEGMGATVNDHLVYLDCYGCTVIKNKFNNINTAPGFDFFWQVRDRTVQFEAITFTRSHAGREFITGSGASEIAINVFP